MTRTLSLLLLSLAFTALPEIFAARPNILLLMPDQWRWDWDGLSHPNAGQAPPIKVPHMNRLRSLGTTFPRGGVVPSPLCAPSRAAMSSLREYDHAGVATNDAKRRQWHPRWNPALPVLSGLPMQPDATGHRRVPHRLDLNRPTPNRIRDRLPRPHPRRNGHRRRAVHHALGLQESER